MWAYIGAWLEVIAVAVSDAPSRPPSGGTVTLMPVGGYTRVSNAYCEANKGVANAFRVRWGLRPRGGAWGYPPG